MHIKKQFILSIALTTIIINSVHSSYYERTDQPPAYQQPAGFMTHLTFQQLGLPNKRDLGIDQDMLYRAVISQGNQNLMVIAHQYNLLFSSRKLRAALEYADSNGHTALHHAAMMYDLEAVENLIRLGTTCNKRASLIEWMKYNNDYFSSETQKLIIAAINKGLKARKSQLQHQSITPLPIQPSSTTSLLYPPSVISTTTSSEEEEYSTEKLQGILAALKLPR